MGNIFDLFRKIETAQPSRPLTPPTHLIVGLGNPGKTYFNTRHNAGFLAIDDIANRCGAVIDHAKFQGLYADVTIQGVRTLLIKPQTYMNASGACVRDFAQFYKIPPTHICVLCDDINLDVGRLRVRRSGTDGGQRGVRDIIYQLGADNFPRIKIGVGQKPHPQMPLADWVLSPFSKTEWDTLHAQFEKLYFGVQDILQENIDQAMQRCNAKE